MFISPLMTRTPGRARLNYSYLNTLISGGRVYSNNATPAEVLYAGVFTGVLFVFVPNGLAATNFTILTAATALAASSYGVGIRCTTTGTNTCNFSVVDGPTDANGHIPTPSHIYSDGRSFPTGAWYKVGWYWSQNADFATSAFWINNEPALMTGTTQVTVNQSLEFLSVFNGGTPVGVKLGQVLAGLSSSISRASIGLYITGRSLPKAPSWILSNQAVFLGAQLALFIDDGDATLFDHSTNAAMTLVGALVYTRNPDIVQTA